MERFINSRTGKVVFFSQYTVDKGLPSHYVRPEVLRSFPPKKKQEEPVNDLVGFLKDAVARVEEPVTEEPIVEEKPKEPTRKEMMVYLRDKGVKFSPNSGTEKLKERYYENKE